VSAGGDLCCSILAKNKISAKININIVIIQMLPEEYQFGLLEKSGNRYLKDFGDLSKQMKLELLMNRYLKDIVVLLLFPVD
jgi:hypothetical protein